MTLGEKISILRKKNNLSQLELAKEIGVSRDTIGKYERNDITPTIERAKKMAEAFGVSLDFLVSEEAEEPKTAMDKNMALRVKEIQMLSEKDKDKILSIVDAFIRDTKAKQSFGLTK